MLIQTKGKLLQALHYILFFLIIRGRRVRDRMVVVFTTMYAISAYHN